MFVMHRLGEISDLSDVSEWNWVPSELNPADDGTRWTPSALRKDSRWVLGPDFLRNSESSWPRENSRANVQSDDSCERRVQIFSIGVCHKATDLLVSLPDVSRFSKRSRLLETTACVLKAIKLFSKRPYNIFELKSEAENLWLKQSQAASFSEDLKRLNNSLTISKNSRLSALTPVVDGEGFLRINGRVKELPELDLKFDMLILDAKHRAVRLLIEHYHVKFFHGSHETVINELRQKFWIIGVRRVLRSIISSCVTCRIQRAKPPNPQMSDLPNARLGFRQRPFSHCGIDYFGPMTVKVGRRVEKRWGALFTCMVTRAIFIELVNSLSADSTIMALHRFSARRGAPVVVYSDCGTNFKGASEELKLAIRDIDTEKQAGYAKRCNFNWRFNPPTASHMGGVWEHLIHSVKTALAVTLKQQNPSEGTLRTVLAEVEHSVNSRPLTHVSPDPRDLEALTPNHFLFGTSSTEIKVDRLDISVTCPRKCWRLAQCYVEMFWRRWLKEYLPTLLPRSKWSQKDQNLKEGDIVLILDDQAPRNVWRRGVIIRAFIGNNGQTRVAEVKTAKGVLVRPCRKLIKFAEVQNS